MSGTTPRLVPIPAEEWSDDARNALRNAFSPAVDDRFFGTGPDTVPIPNVLATLMHHPALAGPFLTYNNVLLRQPALEPRVREIVILRVAWNTRSPYEWLQHVRIATSVGVTPAEIDAIAHDTDAESWSPLEADVLAATDQLCDHYRVDDDTWARLAGRLDERQLVELVFVAGTYTCLAMAFNSFGLQLDPDLQAIAFAPVPEFPIPEFPIPGFEE